MIKARQQNNEISEKVLTPLPEGIYLVEVVELGKWEKKVKAVEQINAKDSKGNLLRDDNKQIVKDTVKNYEFYTLDVKMRVVDGEHSGRIVYGSLTTHDNVLFLTEGFLYAVGVDQLNDLDDIYKNKIVGKVLKVETTNQTYTKDVMDKDTGIATPVEKVRTRIKKYIKNPIVNNA